MKRIVRTAAAAAFASLLCANAGAKIVMFDIPGATSITPVAINDKGQVTGYYEDRFVYGFLRQPDGTLVTFACCGSYFTHPVAIRPTGEITGRFAGQRKSAGGFVRAVDGSFAPFNVRRGRYTTPLGANGKGWIVGIYQSKSNSPYGAFLRSPTGKTTEFTVPDLIPEVVNDALTAAGYAWTSDGVLGFVRSADGTITMFGDSKLVTNVTGINEAGTITGSLSGQQSEGFIRASDGTITTFAAPNGATGTFPSAINNSGTIAGTFSKSNNTMHGFLRAADGTFTPFDVRGTTNTSISAINDKGAIAGTATDNDGIQHGFIGKP